MTAPVNKDNIIVGAGRLLKCEEEDVASIASGTDDIVLSAAPDTTPLADDIIFVTGIDNYEDVGIYTISVWDSGTSTITVNELISNNQGATGGKVVFLSRGGRALGGTDDGTEISGSKDFHDSQAAEAPVTLKKTITQYTGNTTFNLLEATLDNLLLAMGPGDIDLGTLTIAVPSDGHVEEYGLRLETKGPAGVTTRKYMIPRLVSVGDGGHQYTKGGNTVIATEGEMLPVYNDSIKKWEFCKIQDS